MMKDFETNEIVEILERLDPVINYYLLQTANENREDLKQHLYEIIIKSLKKVNFSEPKGLFVKI